MRGKFAADDMRSPEEERGREIAQKIALRKLTAVPSDPIDFDADYRRTLGMIAEGNFVTEKDMDRRRQEILGYNFDDESKEVPAVEVAAQTNIESAEAETMIGKLRTALKRVLSVF